MRICFDLDNTLCTGYPYKDATPFDKARELLISLREEGHVVIIYTARGMGRTSGNIGSTLAEIGRITFNQLKEWGFEYDEIYFGKPAADMYIDDKAIPAASIEVIEIIIQKHQAALKEFSRKAAIYDQQVDGLIDKLDKLIDGGDQDVSGK